MDEVLQAQFARMETALNTLVDSIASFNPSEKAASDLVAADVELSNGLDQLSEHQENHRRILALRAEAEDLEAKLKSSVGTLASLRRAIFETPATTFTENARPVPFDELLRYANAISAYTVPPTYREQVPKSDQEAGKDKEKEDSGSSGVQSNGVTTPAVPNAPAVAGELPMEGAEADTTAAQHEVTPEQAEWLKKLQERRDPWVPYPNNDKIRSGNLMAIQFLLDQKKNPWTEQVPSQQELVDELERQKDAEEQSAAEAPAGAEQQLPIRRESTIQAPREPQQPVQQFQGFDFDEDDD